MKLVVSKNNSSRRSTRTNKAIGNAQKNPWLWILSGILVGILISSTLFIKFSYYQQKLNDPTQKTKTNTAKTKEIEPVFDFYTVLPKMDATTMQTQASTTKQTDTVKSTMPEKAPVIKTAADIKKIHYLLQIATFAKLDDADQLKAELTLAGFDANIAPIQKNNTTWYRIILGPFRVEQQAIKQQQLLAKQNFNGSLLKIEQ